MKWIPVVGYEGLYEVSDQGKLRSLDRKVVYMREGAEVTANIKGKVMKGTPSTGYLSANLSKEINVYDTERIHRLVCEAFHGPAPVGKPIVNHKNGIKTDNRTVNLEWVSHSENVLHALNTGLTRRPIGENNPAATINEDQVREISKLLDAESPTLKSLADRFNTTVTIIADIKSGRTWDHVTNRAARRVAPDMRVGKHNSNAKRVVNCRGEIFDTVVDAARTYGCDPSSITRNCRGKARTSGEYWDGSRIRWSYSKEDGIC